MQPIRQVSRGKMLRDLRYNDTAKESLSDNIPESMELFYRTWCSSGTVTCRAANALVVDQLGVPFSLRSGQPAHYG